MFGSGEDASKKMKKLEADIENVFQARRDVNREIKALKGTLEMDVLYQNYEKSQNRFKAAPNPKKEKERMDAISEKKAAFDKAKTTLSSLEAQLESSDESIKELEERLDAERKNNAALRQRVDTGKKYIKENSGVEKEYEVANDSWLNISKEMAEYEKWKSVIAKEKELFEREDAAQGATGQLDSLRDQLLKLTKQCLPKVDGLTIKVAAGLDKEGQQEGIFYTEQPIHELSESEYTAMWCRIWDAAGVSHVFIENISSLGTDAVNVLNTIAKNGGMVFATKMDRKTDDISIAFMSEIK
jgi:DNA repair exonuclease SbcCD ATPase subunit